MLSNTLRLNFCYLKIIHILHPRYHPKIIAYILKNKQKKKHAKMKMIKIKNILHRKDTTNPMSSHGHRYSKFKNYLGMMMLIYKATPSNI